MVNFIQNWSCDIDLFDDFHSDFIGYVFFSNIILRIYKKLIATSSIGHFVQDSRNSQKV